MHKEHKNEQPSLAWLWPVVLAFLLAACGGGGGDSGGGGGGGSGLTWWNAESREPAGAGLYTSTGVGPVILGTGTTAWIGPFEVAAGTTAYLPSMTDPARQEITCTTVTSTLIECREREYQNDALLTTSDLRVTPGATAPVGSWAANAGFYPGGISSTQTEASLPLGPTGSLRLSAYVTSGAGLESRLIDFQVANLTVGTYTVGTGLNALGLRLQFPLAGAATEVGEFATAGTLTISTLTGTTLGSRVIGTYSLTFGTAGTATGTFDVFLTDV